MRNERYEFAVDMDGTRAEIELPRHNWKLTLGSVGYPDLGVEGHTLADIEQFLTEREVSAELHGPYYWCWDSMEVEDKGRQGHPVAAALMGLLPKVLRRQAPAPVPPSRKIPVVGAYCCVLLLSPADEDRWSEDLRKRFDLDMAEEVRNRATSYSMLGDFNLKETLIRDFGGLPGQHRTIRIGPTP